MAKLTQHDRDLRDARFLKGRLLNLKKLTQVLIDEHWAVQTHEDGRDLHTINTTLDTMLKRLSGVHMPEKK